jgi:RNA polymerase sigma-70 factor (ECF subfamily)
MDGTARKACARLMDSCGDPVYKFCRSLIWNQQDADDLFQDTFLEAFHRREKLCREANPTGLMLAIAANLWRRRKRRFARRKRLAPEAPLDDAVPGTAIRRRHICPWRKPAWFMRPLLRSRTD